MAAYPRRGFLDGVEQSMATMQSAETDLEEPFPFLSFVVLQVDAAENCHKMVLPHDQDTFPALVRGPEPDPLK